MSAEHLSQSTDERFELVRTGLTDDIERWECMFEFTESRILTAAKIILARDIDYAGQMMQTIYNRRSQEKKRKEAENEE